MGGGRTEVHLEMEFLNHEELSRPDKGKKESSNLKTKHARIASSSEPSCQSVLPFPVDPECITENA